MAEMSQLKMEGMNEEVLMVDNRSVATRFLHSSLLIAFSSTFYLVDLYQKRDLTHSHNDPVAPL